MRIKIDKGLFVLIDAEDYDLVSTSSFWAINHDGYAQGKINKKTIVMHRLIMGFPKGMLIDHINFNKLDNRKRNLRLCTVSQNVQHREKIKKLTKSLYKGVEPIRNKWRARIGINRKKINLGTFKTEIEAAKAYNKAAIKYFGEFAVLNEVKNA